MYKIGSVKIKNRLVLAPMISITDISFRMLCKKYGAGLVYTEMASAEAVIRNKDYDKIRFDKREKPIAIQLFGDDKESLSKAAEIVEELGADIVDVNMGCPDHIVMKSGAGAALLKKPEKVGEIIKAMVKKVDIPITAKIRIGFKKGKEGVKIAKILEENGASAIAVHGRTVEQGYSGEADWDFIKEVKEKVNIPIIGNGDIFSGEDAEMMLSQTKCDFVMVGRGAIGNPLIFRDIQRYLDGKKKIKTSDKEKIDSFFNYLEIAKKIKGFDFKILKHQLIYFTKGIKYSAQLRVKLNKIKDIKDMIDEIKAFRSSLPDA